MGVAKTGLTNHWVEGKAGWTELPELTPKSKHSKASHLKEMLP
jgi:hypothetical protein